VASSGAYVYGSYPDIDRLVGEPATELDPKRRGTTLERIQQLMQLRRPSSRPSGRSVTCMAWGHE
jgi:hypothetical protein